MVILISDLLADREPLFRGLEMLRHRRHDLLVFHILDEDELDFPFAGTTRFEGMEELPQLLCDPRALRDVRVLPNAAWSAGALDRRGAAAWLGGERRHRPNGLGTLRLRHNAARADAKNPLPPAK